MGYPDTVIGRGPPLFPAEVLLLSSAGFLLLGLGLLSLGPGVHYLCLLVDVFMGKEGEAPPSSSGPRWGESLASPGSISLLPAPNYRPFHLLTISVLGCNWRREGLLLFSSSLPRRGSSTFLGGDFLV